MPRTLAVGLAGLLLLASCSRRPALPESIVWIVVDTLRADHVPAYGYARPTLPSLDRLTARGVRFERAYAPLPETTPSIASMLTGLLPHRHGVTRLYNVLPREVESIAERLRDAGWATGGFVSSFVMVSSFSGLEQGFDVYDDFVDDRERYRENFERRAGATLERAAAWLDQVAGRRSFCFIHLIDPHGPYDPPDGFAERFHSPESREVEGEIPEYQQIPGVRDFFRYDDLYDGEIAYLDRELDRFLAGRAARGALERTLVVFTADHGESFGEHGVFFQHGSDLFEENVRVPLVVAPPDGGEFARRATCPTPVSVTDLAPTVLELAGLAPSGSLDGRSLAGALRGAPLPAAPLVLVVHPGEHPTWALVEGRLKTIRRPGRTRLYDLATDAGEQRPLPPDPARRRALALRATELGALRLSFEARNNFLDPSRREEFLRRRGRAGDEDLERLRSLGYVR